MGSPAQRSLDQVTFHSRPPTLPNLFLQFPLDSSFLPPAPFRGKGAPASSFSQSKGCPISSGWDPVLGGHVDGPGAHSKEPFPASSQSGCQGTEKHGEQGWAPSALVDV